MSGMHAASSPGWMQQQLDADELPQTFDEDFAAGRVWLGFMTARLMVALLLLALQGMASVLEHEDTPWLLPLCLSYVAATVASRIWVAPVRLGKDFEALWPFTVGLDLVFYFIISWFGHAGVVSFLPLLALPPLICAVLGSWRTTFMTVLLAVLLMGIHNWHKQAGVFDSPWMFHAQMTSYGVAVLILSYMLHRMAQSLGLQQIAAAGNQQLARLHGRINDLVVQSVQDGVMVIGRSGRIRALNPSAHAMLQLRAGRRQVVGLRMQQVPEMQPLVHLVQQSLDEGEGITAEVLLLATERAPHLLVRTRVTLADAKRPDDESLCLLYMQDMQRLQDQMRTEKLAAMGRMSAAVAHEIRNPLAAIAQASELLEEELDQPLQKKLSGMVHANVKRLGRIVTDVLDTASLQKLPDSAAPLSLDAHVRQCCDEWLAQNPAAADSLHLALQAEATQVQFDAEHLRRVLVNLLDNALRYGAQNGEGRIQVGSLVTAGQVCLQVWSRGAPLDPLLQTCLFEPFASGHSRSTGLGLYICRELCQRYGADTHYRRCVADMAETAEPVSGDGAEEGNAFRVCMPSAAPAPPPPDKESTSP